MRLSRLFFWALLAAWVSAVGCGKQAPQAGGITAEVDVLDASKFRPAFESAPAETKGQVNKIMLAIGSSDYVSALSDLESLTNAPGLTEDQKKISADLSQQLQKKLATLPANQ